VTLALPLMSVVALGELRVPQALLGAPLKVNTTKSFALPFPLTVAFTTEVVLPSAGTLGGVADTTIVSVAVPCCVITVDVLLPVPDSVALTVQKPETRLAVYWSFGVTPPAPVVSEDAASVPQAPAGLGLNV
jgi:hypothetical protein